MEATIKINSVQSRAIYDVENDPKVLEVVWLGVAAQHGIITANITDVTWMGESEFVIQYEPVTDKPEEDQPCHFPVDDSEISEDELADIAKNAFVLIKRKQIKNMLRDIDEAKFVEAYRM